MDRRGFLCALCAVPAAAAGVRLSPPALTPFAQVQRLMARGLEDMQRTLDRVVFSDPLYTNGRLGWTREDGVVEWMPPIDDHGPP